MVRAFLFLTLLAGLLGAAACGGTTPAPPASPPAPQPSLQPSPTGATDEEGAPVAIHKIQMTGAETGWGLTEEDNHILRTRDGGHTWQDLTPPGVDQGFQAFFLDDARAWLVASQGGAESGGTPAADQRWSIYRTQDSGQSWQTFPLGFAEATVQFADPQHGLAGANPACSGGMCQITFFLTADGGVTWSPVPAARWPGGGPGLDPGRLNLQTGDWFHLQDPQTIWFGGNGYAASPFASLTVSRDGGLTWDQERLPLQGTDPAAGANNWVELPVFLNQAEGFFDAKYELGGKSLMAVYATHDRGQTWEALPAQVQGVTWQDPVQFVSLKDAFVHCGEAICATHDGGQTWKAIAANLRFSPDAGNVLVGFSFIDAQRGWALVAQAEQPPAVYRTTDGGTTWTDLQAQVMPR